MFEDGKFFTPSGKARFISVEAEMPVAQTSDEHSLMLNTGRVRDQWHTMKRTGISARLSSHISQPSVEINPDDEDMRGVKEGDLLCQLDDKGVWAEYFDKARQTYRGARFVDNRLESCVFVSQAATNLPETNWLKQLLIQQSNRRYEFN